MADFKIGDVVQLKSGGPRMTVTLAARDGEFHCAWFPAENVRPESYVFKGLCLKPSPSKFTPSSPPADLATE